MAIPRREFLGTVGAGAAAAAVARLPMDTHARISLSTPEDMREFWRAWDQL